MGNLNTGRIKNQKALNWRPSSLQNHTLQHKKKKKKTQAKWKKFEICKEVFQPQTHLQG